MIAFAVVCAFLVGCKPKKGDEAESPPPSPTAHVQSPSETAKALFPENLAQFKTSTPGARLLDYAASAKPALSATAAPSMKAYDDKAFAPNFMMESFEDADFAPPSAPPADTPMCAFGAPQTAGWQNLTVPSESKFDPAYVEFLAKSIVDNGCRDYLPTSDCMPIFAPDSSEPYAGFYAWRNTIRYNVANLAKIATKKHWDVDSQMFLHLFASILAHEYGHFIDRQSGGRFRYALMSAHADWSTELADDHREDKQKELFADFVAGCATAVSIIDPEALIFFFQETGSDQTHPGPSLRTKAFNAGWTQCSTRPPPGRLTAAFADAGSGGG